AAQGHDESPPTYSREQIGGPVRLVLTEDARTGSGRRVSHLHADKRNALVRLLLPDAALFHGAVKRLPRPDFLTLKSLSLTPIRVGKVRVSARQHSVVVGGFENARKESGKRVRRLPILARRPANRLRVAKAAVVPLHSTAHSPCHDP